MNRVNGVTVYFPIQHWGYIQVLNWCRVRFGARRTDVDKDGRFVVSVFEC